MQMESILLNIDCRELFQIYDIETVGLSRPQTAMASITGGSEYKNRIKTGMIVGYSY